MDKTEIIALMENYEANSTRGKDIYALKTAYKKYGFPNLTEEEIVQAHAEARRLPAIDFPVRRAPQRTSDVKRRETLARALLALNSFIEGAVKTLKEAAAKQGVSYSVLKKTKHKLRTGELRQITENQRLPPIGRPPRETVITDTFIRSQVGLMKGMLTPGYLHSAFKMTFPQQQAPSETWFRRRLKKLRITRKLVASCPATRNAQ